MRISDWSSDVCSSDLVNGISSSEEAKIGGMTPAVLIFSGRCELSPCIMPWAVWRLGYWIRIFRCARSMKQMNAMKPKIGRAHVCTPVTNAHLVCRLLLEKKNQ